MNWCLNKHNGEKRRERKERKSPRKLSKERKKERTMKCKINRFLPIIF